MDTTSLLLMRRGSAPPVHQWPPPPRAPLPPDPVPTGTQPPPPEASCWTSVGDYAHDLQQPIPEQPDRSFHRGNFCGVRVPGLISSSCEDRSLFFTWEATNFSDDQMRLAVDYHVDVCGYTHIVLSRQQTINQGKTLDDLIRVARYCQSRGLFVCMVAVSDNDDFSVAIPWLEALLGAGALVSGKDLVPLCWQVDKWYAPAGVVRLVIEGGTWCHQRGLLTTLHWGGGPYDGWAESCAIWDDETEADWGIHDRWTFQSVLQKYLDGHYGQCNQDSQIDQVQSWISKVVVAFPPSRQMFFVASEMDANAEYYNPYQRLELYGDQKGFLACCAPLHNAQSVSYLNGARRRDGRVL